MESLEGLSQKIRTAHELLSVVKTMKSLAAVNIRQYVAAAEAMDAYSAVINSGWQALLLRQRSHPLSRQRDTGPVCCLVLGSDQGMCGQFNEVITQCARERAEVLGADGTPTVFWSAGERVRAILEDDSEVGEHFPLPVSIDAISDLIARIVNRFAALHTEERVGRLVICHNRLGRGGTYATSSSQVFPLDHLASWGKKWPNRCLPLLGIREEQLFEHLFRQHLFATIYTAFAQSMAGENAARLTAMQAAEQNILEMEEDLKAEFRETRQNTITAELLDIVSGFEALSPT